MKLTLVPMLRILLIQCLLTMILALPFTKAQAHQQNYSQKVSSYIFEGEKLDILQELNFKTNKETLKEVNIQIQALDTDCMATVFINGEVLKEKNIDSKTNSLSMTIPSGSNLKSLTLEASAAFIHNIEVRSQTKKANNTETIKLSVGKKLVGSQKMSLTELIEMAKGNVDNTQVIESVKIISKGRGLISITGKELHEGSVFVRPRHSAQTIKTNHSENLISDINLELNGKIFVKAISLKLKPLEAPM